MDNPGALDLSADGHVFKKKSQIYFHAGVDVFSQNIERSLSLFIWYLVRLLL